MVKSTVFWSALALMIGSSLAPCRGVISAEENQSEDASAPKEPAGQRVRVPLEGVEFYARSIRLSGTKVIATGDLRARLERFPRVEIRATRLEYRVGGDKVSLHDLVWTYPIEEKESDRLTIHAESATFRIDDEIVVAKALRLCIDDGAFLVSLETPSGTWRSKSRDFLLESVEGEVFTAVDEKGRGSPDDENFRVRIARATARLSPDGTLDEVRLDRISGSERKSGYRFEAASGLLDASHGARLREARLTRVEIAAPQGWRVDSDTLTYRPPPAREAKETSREPSE